MFSIVVLFAFMLIPVWIPLIAVTAGAISDRIRTPEPPSRMMQARLQRAAAAEAAAS